MNEMEKLLNSAMCAVEINRSLNKYIGDDAELFEILIGGIIHAWMLTNGYDETDVLTVLMRMADREIKIKGDKDDESNKK